MDDSKERWHVALHALRARAAASKEDNFLFFWGHTGKGERVGKECLSQWYPASFVENGTRYLHAEQFMMAEKARIFGDEEMRDQILDEPSPMGCKQLGRKVRGFEESVWREERFAIVVRASLAKFAQNAPLGAFLAGSDPRILVEASPRDRIWGIGMGAKNDKAGNAALWRGQNLLGYALTIARQELAVKSA